MLPYAPFVAWYFCMVTQGGYCWATTSINEGIIVVAKTAKVKLINDSAGSLFMDICSLGAGQLRSQFLKEVRRGAAVI